MIFLGLFMYVKNKKILEFQVCTIVSSVLIFWYCNQEISCSISCSINSSTERVFTTQVQYTLLLCINGFLYYCTKKSPWRINWFYVLRLERIVMFWFWKKILQINKEKLYMFQEDEIYTFSKTRMVWGSKQSWTQFESKYHCVLKGPVSPCGCSCNRRGNERIINSRWWHLCTCHTWWAPL